MSALLGLAGRAGSGKSTVARLLREHGYVERAFAGPLKAFAGYLLAIQDEQLYGPSAARDAPIPGAGDEDSWRYVWRRAWSPATYDVVHALVDGVGGSFKLQIEAMASLERELDAWQALGDGLTTRHVLQRLGANWGRELHPEIWIRSTLREARAHDRVVISDCRFENEAAAIVAAGGRVAWIEADARIGPRPPDAHASEPRRADLAAWITDDIDNNGGLDALDVQVAALAGRP